MEERVEFYSAPFVFLTDTFTGKFLCGYEVWLHELPTEKQIALLPEKSKLDYNLTRYQASARITFKINEEGMKKLITEASG